jgi:hypothetical protein
MSTKFRGVVCDENGIGGSGKYCGGNDVHLGRFNVHNHEALGSKYDAGNLVNYTRGQKLGRRPLQKG